MALKWLRKTKKGQHKGNIMVFPDQVGNDKEKVGISKPEGSHRGISPQNKAKTSEKQIIQRLAGRDACATDRKIAGILNSEIHSRGAAATN